jgi:hypothetical protein
MPLVKQFSLDHSHQPVLLYSDGTMRRRVAAELQSGPVEWQDVDLSGVEGKVSQFAIGLNSNLTVLTIDGRLWENFKGRYSGHRDALKWREVPT